jgi:hypothetical protein
MLTFQSGRFAQRRLRDSTAVSKAELPSNIHIVQPKPEINWSEEFTRYWGITGVETVTTQPRIAHVNVFSPYYTCSSSNRQLELDACVKWNSKVPGVKLFLVVDKECSVFPTENVTIVRRVTNGRIKYQEILEYVRTYTRDDEINCIINSDIIIDTDFTKKLHVGRGDAMCLTRYEIDFKKINVRDISPLTLQNAIYSAPENPGSQDLWLFVGHINDVVLDFYMGIPGCDNLTSLEFYNKGYRLFNPATSQRIYHIHSVQNDQHSYPFTYFNLPEFKLCFIQIS